MRRKVQWQTMKRQIEEIKDKIVPVLKRHNVVHAAIFGSFVRGEVKKDSDIDILVEFKGEKSLLDLVALKIELEDLLGRDVDVLTYNSLHPFIRESVLKEQVTIL